MGKDEVNSKYKNFVYSPIIGKTSTEILKLNKNNDTKVAQEFNGKHSILNRNQDTNSHFLLIKSYNISRYPMLLHWYVAYKNIEWHPGTPDNDIYVPRNYYNKPNIVNKIYECCTDCGNEFMKKNIEKDKNFFLLCYNCDTMLGNCVETILFGVMFILLLMSLILKSLIAFVFFIVSLISLFFTNSVIKTSIYYEKCEHIECL